MERGERNPSLTTVYKIADALEIRPSEIHARAEQLQDAGKQH
jgi:DNA-binding XRE family transcriptional regulator